MVRGRRLAVVGQIRRDCSQANGHSMPIRFHAGVSIKAATPKSLVRDGRTCSQKSDFVANWPRSGSKNEAPRNIPCRFGDARGSNPLIKFKNCLRIALSSFIFT